MHAVIRVDGGPNIGYGHLVRSGAVIGELIAHGHTVTVATATVQSVYEILPDTIETVELPVRGDPDPFVRWLETATPDLVFTDAYPVDTEYQRAVRACVPLVVCQDDTRHTVAADILVNGNVYAPSLDYEYEGSEPEWCLGPEYLLLREEIRTQASQSSPWRDSPERALVTMGGSDIQYTTPELIPAFAGTNIVVDVIIGPGFDDENVDEIERVAANTDANIQLLHNPPDLAERMLQADIAVSATGSTSYELLALATPTIGIPQADNQIPIAEVLDERGAMVHLPGAEIGRLGETVETLVAAPERRWSLRETGRTLIGCQGPKHIYNALTRLQQVDI